MDKEERLELINKITRELVEVMPRNLSPYVDKLTDGEAGDLIASSLASYSVMALSRLIVCSHNPGMADDFLDDYQSSVTRAVKKSVEEYMKHDGMFH